MKSIVNSHFVNKLLNAKINTEPFSHSYIEEIFPNDFYQELMKNIPNFSLFSKLATKDTLEIQHLGILKKVNSFWTEFIYWICSKEIQEIFVKAFDVEQGYSHVVIYNQKKNFKLGPHIDNRTKLFTSLFYLPKDDTLSKYGTGMYRPNVQKPKPFEFEDFDLIKKLDFKPNSFFCFGKENSWHGVEHINEDINRLTMQYLITTEKLPGLYYHSN